jgi:uncharacterized membrane protein
MSGELQLWVRAFHVLGFILWVGSMFGLVEVLRSLGRSGDGGARTELSALAQRMARVMDIAATIAIVAGVLALVGTRALGDAWPMKQGWMHAKLALVILGFLGLHGYLRVLAGKMSRGDAKQPPALLKPVMGLLVLAVIVLAVVRPF